MRSVRKRLEVELSIKKLHGPKYMNLLNYFIEKINIHNKINEYYDLLVSCI